MHAQWCMDSGAMVSFIDLSFAQSLNLPLIKKKTPVYIVSFDGSPSVSGAVIFECQLKLQVVHRYRGRISTSVQLHILQDSLSSF